MEREESKSQVTESKSQHEMELKLDVNLWGNKVKASLKQHPGSSDFLGIIKGPIKFHLPFNNIDIKCLSEEIKIDELNFDSEQSHIEFRSLKLPGLPFEVSGAISRDNDKNNANKGPQMAIWSENKFDLSLDQISKIINDFGTINHKSIPLSLENVKFFATMSNKIYTKHSLYNDKLNGAYFAFSGTLKYDEIIDQEIKLYFDNSTKQLQGSLNKIEKIHGIDIRIERAQIGLQKTGISIEGTAKVFSTEFDISMTRTKDKNMWSLIAHNISISNILNKLYPKCPSNLIKILSVTFKKITITNQNKANKFQIVEGILEEEKDEIIGKLLNKLKLNPDDLKLKTNDETNEIELSFTKQIPVRFNKRDIIKDGKLELSMGINQDLDVFFGGSFESEIHLINQWVAFKIGAKIVLSLKDEDASIVFDAELKSKWKPFSFIEIKQCSAMIQRNQTGEFEKISAVMETNLFGYDSKSVIHRDEKNYAIRTEIKNVSLSGVLSSIGIKSNAIKEHDISIKNVVQSIANNDIDVFDNHIQKGVLVKGDVDLFNLIHGALFFQISKKEIKASIDIDMNNLNELLNEIHDRIKKELDKAEKAVHEKFDTAQNELRSAKQAFDKAKQKATNAINKVEKKIDSLEKNIKHYQKKVKHGHFWHEGKVIGLKAAKEVAKLALEAAKEIEKGVLNGTKQATYHVANEALTLAKNTFDAVVHSVKIITDFITNNKLFSFKKFDANLVVSPKQFKFKASIDITVLQKNFDFEIDIDIDIHKIIERIFQEIWKMIKSIHVMS